MHGPDRWDALIGLIYDAALDRQVWPLIVDRLADAMGAVVGHIGSFDARTHAVVNIAPRLAPGSLADYAENWARRNPLVEPSGCIPVGDVFRFDDVMPRDIFMRTAIYNEWFAPLGLNEKLGARLLVNGPISVMLGLYRPASMPAFTQSETMLLTQLIPHLQRAVQLNARLAELDAAQKFTADILDRMRQASLLVDATCRVLFANRAAEAILADRLGLHRGPGGVLHADRQIETTALRRLVAKGPDEAERRLQLSRGEFRAPLNVLAIPLRAEMDWPTISRPSAILFVSDPERVEGPTALALREGFGLTRAEAAVTLEVLNGHGLKVAAARLGVSPTTARTHLSAVFDKTGTRRQAELVRAIAQVPDLLNVS